MAGVRRVRRIIKELCVCVPVTQKMRGWGGVLGSTEEKDENWEEFFLLMRIK